jgi:hypothetical protein
MSSRNEFLTRCFKACASRRIINDPKFLNNNVLSAMSKKKKVTILRFWEGGTL